ncbi:MAG: hypothetical protein ACRCY8_04500, partial [Dermatophilaceae bacterium]
MRPPRLLGTVAVPTVPGCERGTYRAAVLDAGGPFARRDLPSETVGTGAQDRLPRLHQLLQEIGSPSGRVVVGDLR